MKYLYRSFLAIVLLEENLNLFTRANFISISPLCPCLNISVAFPLNYSSSLFRLIIFVDYGSSDLRTAWIIASRLLESTGSIFERILSKSFLILRLFSALGEASSVGIYSLPLFGSNLSSPASAAYSINAWRVIVQWGCSLPHSQPFVLNYFLLIFFFACLGF